MPNSSKSSGSALVIPRTKRLKESVKSRPKAWDTFLAAAPNLFNCSGLNPAAVPIAAAFAASAYAICPPVASLILAVIVL